MSESKTTFSKKEVLQLIDEIKAEAEKSIEDAFNEGYKAATVFYKPKLKGYEIENIDSIIVAQSPKMRPYIDDMRKNIADACGICISQVSVKATTEEGLGFTGKGEGIASKAICLLK